MLALPGRGAKMMGKLWLVDNALEEAEGLGWVRERLEVYDW
jgi:hypothetical protein